MQSKNSDLKIQGPLAKSYNILLILTTPFLSLSKITQFLASVGFFRLVTKSYITPKGHVENNEAKVLHMFCMGQYK